MCIYIHIYTHVYIHICMYVFPLGPASLQRQGARDARLEGTSNRRSRSRSRSSSNCNSNSRSRSIPRGK